MKTIQSAEQVLRENYNEYEKDNMSFVEYVERESENDPEFFRWLFNDDSDDFSLTEEHKEAFTNFLNSLQ